MFVPPRQRFFPSQDLHVDLFGRSHSRLVVDAEPDVGLEAAATAVTAWASAPPPPPAAAAGGTPAASAAFLNELPLRDLHAVWKAFAADAGAVDPALLAAAVRGLAAAGVVPAIQQLRLLSQQHEDHAAAADINGACASVAAPSEPLLPSAADVEDVVGEVVKIVAWLLCHLLQASADHESPAAAAANQQSKQQQHERLKQSAGCSIKATSQQTKAVAGTLSSVKVCALRLLRELFEAADDAGYAPLAAKHPLELRALAQVGRRF